MSHEELRREVDTVVAKLNSRRCRSDDTYEANIDTHTTGPAIDIRQDGEAPHKVVGQFAKAAMRAGYVVTGVNVAEDYHVSEDHTRLFLHEADEFLDLGASEEELNDARLEGFLAGIFVAATAELEGWT